MQVALVCLVVEFSHSVSKNSCKMRLNDRSLDPWIEDERWTERLNIFAVWAVSNYLLAGLLCFVLLSLFDVVLVLDHKARQHRGLADN